MQTQDGIIFKYGKVTYKQIAIHLPWQTAEINADTIQAMDCWLPLLTDEGQILSGLQN